MEGIKSVYILHPEKALLVRAKEGFKDNTKVKGSALAIERKPGDRWFVYGPGEYCPPIQVEVVDIRTAKIQIDGLGIYAVYSTASFVLLLILAFLLTLTVPKFLYY